MGKTVLALVCLLAIHPAYAGWTYHERTGDFDDKKIFFTIYSFPDRYDDRAVFISCYPHLSGMSARIDFGKFLNGKSEPVPVEYRIDKGPVYESTWAAYDDTYAYVSDSVSYLEALRFAKRVLNGKKLILRATDWEGYGHTIRVDLAGAHRPIKKVLVACGN